MTSTWLPDGLESPFTSVELEYDDERDLEATYAPDGSELMEYGSDHERDSARSGWSVEDEEPDYGSGGESHAFLPASVPFDTEAFIGSLIDGARQALSGLVADAVRRGQRDPSALSDLVFHHRHPQRAGRRLSHDEPGAGALMDEWKRIRHGLVLPMLAAAGNSTRVSQVPSNTAARDAAHWGDVRSRIVEVARDELAYWEHGAIRESEEKGWKRIEGYWRDTVGWTPKQRAGRALAQENAWSGVFICWVLKQSGVRHKTDFWFRANHSNYLVDLIRQVGRAPQHPITVHDPSSVSLRPGDLINNWRTSPFDLGALRSDAVSNRHPNRPSHTDVVLEVYPGSHAIVVGGNKDNTVKTSRRPIDGNCVLTPGRWVAVVRIGPKG